MQFNEIQLSGEMLKAIDQIGYTDMTEIQEKSIPVILSGRDIIGRSNTGTGKTAAFGIPAVENICRENNGKVQTLILCPTRELAVQAAEEIKKYSRFMPWVKVSAVYGGSSMDRQIHELKRGANIVVGTPGRVMDHIRRRTLKLADLQSIILDEADEMLNMGFREDIEEILGYVPEKRQTILFSATMPPEIMAITENFQNDPVVIKTLSKSRTVEAIDQSYYVVNSDKKADALYVLWLYNAPKSSMIFCNTKKMVDELTEYLAEKGIRAEGIHGDMKQVQRDRVMKNFRNGKTDILIATDVAARGIDVDDVEAVFNYDLPQDDEYYVHRIGRTGRAGRCGKAFSFVKGKEVYKLKDIQRYCKTKIYAQPIPSSDDVAKIRAEKIMDQISTIIDEENLTSVIDIIENQINESDYTAMDIAAAFLYQAMGASEISTAESKDDYDFHNTGAEDGMVRLFINVGKKDKIKPGDILGAIAGESGMPGRLVGAIDMYDKYTFVEVPAEYGKEVLNAMKNAKIKGRSVNMEPANSR